MAKKSVTGPVAELQKAADKLVLGTERTLKLLREGKMKKVFLASNCAADVKEDIERYCELGKVECVQLSQSNEEIGTMCRKPFAISVAGIQA